jgi:hypothetical protein
MSSGRWQERSPETSEPREAQAPPESTPAVFDEVPGEAPTADLGAPREPATSTPERVRAPHEDAAAAPAAVAPQEPVVSTEEEAMSAPDSAPQPVPLAGPDAQTVAGDGHGPGPQSLPSAQYGEQAWWERPEVALGAAFACGLLLAVLLRRRRS